MKKTVAVVLLAALTTPAIADNWVSSRDNSGQRVGVNLDTFERYRTTDGTIVWRAYAAFGDAAPFVAAVEPRHCQRQYGTLIYGPNNGYPSVWNFELSGDTNGDFIAKALCQEGMRRGLY
jgi:hypothetical protein